ncbi:phosphotransferase [Stagnihabitans tardus]|uniref:Hydroxylysine kinase n=1 Tax=Stagnihabitans tardus TaxID=2699202 RepID=A0AAE4Y8T1_9RHOB|nr:phosphotransferase [Stagnihabitans tardus]NBZ88122.1 phosphotransferase [Stagnihabitans tardus]
MPLGSNLTTPPPILPEAEARALLSRHWGIEAELTPLTSERDLNFRVESAPRHVLKLANPAEPHEVTDFQTQALLHLSNSGLPVPRVIPARDGQTLVKTEHGLLRLLTYLEGAPLHAAPRSDAQRAAMGRLNARLTQALAPFRHPGEAQDLQWDIRHTARLAPLLANIPPDLRPLAEATLDAFETQALPLLPSLPWQVVHNDLNPHNLLVGDDPDQVTGILDFGDMLRTARICDMAVAASYQVDPARPGESLGAFARAYHATLPLLPQELALLPLLTRARMLTTLAIAHTRAARYPDNAPYILRNTPSAAAGLAALIDLDWSPR